MSQDIFNDINPTTTTGTELANLLNGFKDAIVSGFSGAARPANLQAGGYWVDDQSNPLIWVMYFYDGTQDIELFNIDVNNGVASINAAGDLLELEKVSDDVLPPELRFIKKRGGLGQTLTGDNLGELKFYGTDSGGVERLQANFLVQTTNDTSITQLGSYFAIEMAEINTGSLAEVLRLTNGEIGLGETIPQSSVHVKRSDAAIRVEREETSADAAKLILQKKRLTNNGQVESGDIISGIEAISADQNGAEFVVSNIETEAVETHTDLARGADVVISTIAAGATTLAERLRISEDGIVVQGNISGNITGDSSTVSDTSDTTNSPTYVTDKQRIAANGQVLTNDGIGKLEMRSTDVDGDEFEGANIEGFALENHDNTNRGTAIRIETIDSTTTTLVTKAQFGDTIDLNAATTVDGNLTVTGDLQVDGTTTTVNSATLEVTDANITVNNGGNQAAADAADAGLTVEMSDATDAVIGYDSTLASKFKIGEVGSEAEIVDVSSTQILTNKQIDSADINTPDIDGGTIDGTTVTSSAIVTPTQLDFKQDTRANLEAYAISQGSAANGEGGYATDTNEYVGFLDGALVPLGGGGGSLDYFYSENCDNLSLSDVNVTGTWTEAIETGALLISGRQSIKLTQASGSLGATAELSNITLELAQKGTTIGFSGKYLYDGSNVDIEFVVEDVTNSQILTRLPLKTASDVTTFRAIFNTKDTTDTLRFYFEVVNENIGAVLVFDNIEGRTNPLSVSGSNVSGYYRITQNGNELTNRSGELQFNLATADIVKKDNIDELLIASDDSANTRTIWTAQAACHVQVDSLMYAAAGIERKIGVNGTPFIGGGQQVGDDQVSGSIYLNAGDFISVGVNTNTDSLDFSNSASVDNAARPMVVTLSASRASNNVVFEGQKKANSYPISIDQTSGTAVVERDDFNIISSVTNLGTGQFRVNFNNALFNNEPHIVGVADGGTPNDRGLQINNVSASSFQVTTYAAGAGTGQNIVSNFIVTAQGSDYVDEFLYSVPVTNEVENVYTAFCTSGPSPTVQSQNVPWITSITDVGTQYDIEWNNLNLTVPPAVTVTPEYISGNVPVAVVDNLTTNGCTIYIRDVSGNSVDHNFSIKLCLQGADYRAPKGYWLGNLSYPTAFLRHRENTNVAGGTMIGGIYQTVPLNDLVDKSGIVKSFLNSQFELEPGRYIIEGEGIGWRTRRLRFKIVNITDTVDELFSANGYSDAVAGINGINETIPIAGEIVVSGSNKFFEFQGYAETTSTTNGFGLQINEGSNPEYYSQLKITKIG